MQLSQPLKTSHRREGSHLTVDVRQIGRDDLLALRVEDAQDRRWESEFFHARARVAQLDLIVGNPD